MNSLLKRVADVSFKEVITSLNIKSIIIAAGLGSRLKKYTEALPKCMLKFGNHTLLEMQLNIYRELGISDISVVRGYKKEKINYEGLNYYENTDFKNNNILNSLFYADEKISGNVIVSYSDILFDSYVVDGYNQWELRTNAEIQKIINSYPVKWTKRDFRGEGKYNSQKILTRKETERPNLKFGHTGNSKHLEEVYKTFNIRKYL